MGADFIEPDLVSTKDRVLVARHENDITGHDRRRRASRVRRAARRPRRSTAPAITGWFTEDFTLAELKTLRAIERLPDAPARATPPSTACTRSRRSRRSSTSPSARSVGIYPETKHPTYFDSIGLSLEEPLVAHAARERARPPRRRRLHPVLRGRQPAGAQRADARCRSSSSSSATGTPVRLRRQGRPAHLRRPHDAGGPARGRHATPTASGRTRTRSSRATRRTGCCAPTSLVADAHRAGLRRAPVHVPAREQLPARGLPPGQPGAARSTCSARGNQPAELELFFKLGVDGVFADNPDTAVAVRRKLFGR